MGCRTESLRGDEAKSCERTDSPITIQLDLVESLAL